MPYETIWEQEGVYQRFSGRITNGDKDRATSAVMEDERFDTIKYRIIDGLAIEEYVLDEENALHAAALDIGATYNKDNFLIVFIATNANHRDNIQHYMRHLKDTHSPWKAQVFEDIESARRWILETLDQ